MKPREPATLAEDLVDLSPTGRVRETWGRPHRGVHRLAGCDHAGLYRHAVWGYAGIATQVGASANSASVGICANQGERLTFLRWMRHGVPITLAALHVFVVRLTRGAMTGTRGSSRFA